MLPAELLERICLYSVENNALPETNISECEDIFRLQTKLNSGVSLAVQALRCRLVCRQFHDAAWRAFRTVVGVTTFDIGARQSMVNFQIIAKQLHLAP